MHGEWEFRDEPDPFSFAGELAGAETVDRAVTAAVEATTAPFDQSVITVCSFDPDEEAVTCVDRSTTAAENPVPPPSTGRIARVHKNDSALRIGETAEAEPTAGLREPLCEEIVAPVGSFGALSVGSTAAGAFDEDDVSIVEGIAAALGSALERIEGGNDPGKAAVGTGDRTGGDADDTDAAALGRLNELTTDAGDVDTTIEAMLSLGCDHLGLEAGILSRVEGTDYHVESVVDATGSYDEGATFALEETMCAATLANRTTEPLSFSDVRDTEHAEHPAAGGVRAYVGVPVVVDGETYGTVNFSSTTARENAFRPAEREFVTFIAGWIGNAIERRRRFAELERYETILEAVDDPVYALDTEGRFTFVNPAAKREFGYGEEILGEDVSIGMREEDIERISDARRALTETDERSVRSQFTLETAGGKERTVENRLAVIGDEEFRGTAGVLRDVTEREKRKREREATVEVFERAYQVTIDPDRSFEEKVDGLLAAGQEYLDLPNGFLTRIEPDTGDGTQTIVDARGSHDLLQPGESCPLPQSYCRRTIGRDDLMTITNAAKTGWEGDPAHDLFGLETYIGGEVTAGGELYGTLCFAATESRSKEFTETERSFVGLLRRWAGYEIERENDQAELREQRERLELVLSGTGTGIAEWDLRTDAVTWNETLRETVGRNPGTVEAFTETVHPEDRDRVQDRLETMLETGESWTGEFRVISGDDEVLWLETRAIPVYEDGDPVRVLATGTDVTDAKRTERERQRNERRFRSLFEDPEMLVALLDTDGTLLDANETALAYVDSPIDDLVGTAFPETPWWAHSEDLQADMRDWIGRAAEGEYVEYEAIHPGPDGDRRDVSGTVRPVTDASGSVTSLVVSGRDVTERRRGERELRDRQRKLDLVLSNTDTAIAELDPAAGTIHWGEGMGEDDIGSPETFEAFLETVHPDDRERVQSALGEMMRTGEPTDAEYRVENVSGEYRWISARSVPVEDGPDSGDIITIATDITDLKEREEALAENQERYRTLLQAAPDPVFVADAETGDIVETNAAAAALRGESREDILGRNQQELHPDDRSEAYRGAFEESIGSDMTIRELPDGTQPQLCTADGRTVPVEINAATVDLPDGPVMYGVFRDVSGRVEKERELELKERAMDEANLGITISDPDRPDNPLVYVNDGFVEQTGYGREEAIGTNCRFLQEGDRDQPPLDRLREAIAEEEPVTVELRNYRKNGDLFWNRLSVTPVYDDRDNLVNYVGIQQDATKEKRREQRLRALHGTTRDLLATEDVHGAIAVAVETLRDDLDMDLAAVYRQEGDELVREVSRGPESPSLPEVVQRDGTPLWEATESADTVVHGDADRGEITTEAYVPLDGHGVAVVGTSDPAWLNEDAVQLIEVLTGNLLAVLDTLDREASLRASERRYRTLAENIPNGGVLTFDANLEYRLAAGEILSELGLEPSDVSGMEAGTVFPDADAGDELVPRFRAALDGERTDRRIEIGDRTIRIHVAPVDPGDGGSIDTRGLVLAQDVTEEARRERELFEERERFRLLTRSVEEYAFVTLDADGDVATWNEGAENLFGYDHETAVGTSIGQFHPAAERESGLPDRLLQQARIAGESAHEGWHVRADGSEFYADVRYAKLRSDDGEVPGYAMIVRDMTDRRRQQRRTERFVEESDDVVSILDTDGTITYASGSADRVLGYDPEDLLGESLFDHLHPDDREAAMETFFGTIRDGTGGAGIECRIESGDGEWLTVDARLRNELDDDAIDGMLLYLRDVTESKRRARRFESIFNQTFQFTGLLDPDGTVIEANDAALEFGGFDREDVIGEFFYDIPWWTHSEEVRESVRDALERAADGEFVRYETKVQGASGMGTIDFSAKPVTDEYGEITLLIVEGRDITAQQERRRQMGMMQRVMRHNMRNDLSEVRGYAGLLHEETDPDKQAEYFGIIEEVLDRWEGVAEKMRVIRKLLQTPPTQGSGREATGLLEDAISEAKNDVPDASIESDVSVDDTVMVSSELEEAVQELIVNAGQASDRNDPRVEVRASGSGEDGIEITVSDDGPGMPDVEVEVLESGDTTALSHGEGLGLWLVRTVVDRAGGDVSVESSSEGTTVVLRIPERRSVGGDDRPARSE